MTERILIADDNPEICTAFRRVLSRDRREIDLACSGAEADRRLRETSYDAVISDIDMPGMTGLDLLRSVRDRNQDVPVILVTGAPQVETAARAVEYRAVRYLSKPVDSEELRAVVDDALRMGKLARIERRALSDIGIEFGAGFDVNGFESRFERALAGMHMAFQPILSWQLESFVGFEALLRCDPNEFPHPGALLAAAEQLDRIHGVGREVRRKVAAAIPRFPGESLSFVNLHPRDLNDPVLVRGDEPLAEHAHRVVLEITESAPLAGVPDLDDNIASLRSQGYRIAIDDLGAGYSGLNSLVRLRPEFVKLDMHLVRNIDCDPERRSVVGALVSLCDSLGVRCIAEGVETWKEARTLADLGSELMQGFLFARPSPEIPSSCDVRGQRAELA